MRVPRCTLLLLTVLAGGALRAAPARAEDPPPAERAFRDAWWAETAAGDLTQALARYAEAADAEGPPAVRARALYRRGLVLQRLGRTPEAIQALERLARDFAGEAQLLAEARARLSEWTAVDLRTSFGEWYRRYQYGPEFQAKIVDLVLRLGGEDGPKAEAVVSELLTIGEPALPALRAHADSRNTNLREQAVRLLVALGDVPAAEALRSTRAWWTSGAMDVLRRAPAEARARLRAELTRKDGIDPGLAAALDGPVAAVRWYRSLTEDDGQAEGSWPHHCLAGAWESALDPAVEAELRALLADGQARPDARGYALAALGGRERLRTEHLLPLLAEPVMQEGVLPHLHARARAGDQPAEAWAALVAAARAAADPAVPEKRRHALSRALCTGLAWAPEPVDAEALGPVVARLGLSEYYRQDVSPRLPAVMLAGAEAATSPVQTRLFLEQWQASAAPTPAEWARARRLLLDATRPALAEGVLRWAKSHLAALVRPALELGVDPALPPRVHEELLLALVRAHLGAIVRDPEQRRLLLRALAPLEERRGSNEGLQQRGVWYVTLVTALAPDAEASRLLAETWLAEPRGWPSLLWGLSAAVPGTLPPGSERWPAARAAVLARLGEVWPRWTWEQRRAALTAPLPRIKALDETLRAALHERPSEATADDRALLYYQLSEVSPEDARAAYDLQDARQAWRVLSVRTSELGPPSAAWLDALGAALAPDSPGARDVATYLLREPSLQRAVCERLLVHQDPSVRSLGLTTLHQRASADDLPLWLKALSDDAVTNRLQAVRGLGALGSRDAARALLGALDDPSAPVRDAAQEALDAFEKLEATKRRWSERLR